MSRAHLLVLVIVLASLVSAAVAVNKYYIQRDYTVYAAVSCDPTRHSCFVGDGENTPEYYAEVSRVANTIPACNGWNDECGELMCAEGDSSCDITYCEPDTETVCYGPIVGE